MLKKRRCFLKLARRKVKRKARQMKLRVILWHIWINNDEPHNFNSYVWKYLHRSNLQNIRLGFIYLWILLIQTFANFNLFLKEIFWSYGFCYNLSWLKRNIYIYMCLFWHPNFKFMTFLPLIFFLFCILKIIFSIPGPFEFYSINTHWCRLIFTWSDFAIWLLISVFVYKSIIVAFGKILFFSNLALTIHK